jgi:pyruvate, water dikinase
VDFLIKLDQLQILDPFQVGDQTFCLSQMLKAGCPVRPGVVVPDEVMRVVWDRIDWSEKILQDFFYLRLNFSLDQAAQVRLIAQTLQQGILDAPLKSKWEATWEQMIPQFGEQQCLLTPYLWIPEHVWIPQRKKERVENLETMLPLPSLRCSTQVEAFWQSLKTVWASLFQAQHLYVLQHLELRPEQIRLSILVQPLRLNQRSGCLKITASHLFIQSGHDLELNRQSATQAESYVYDRIAENFIALPDQKSQRLGTGHQKQPLSKTALQSIIAIAETVERDRPFTDLILSWALDSYPFNPDLQILGILPDLPLPLEIPQAKRSQPQKTLIEESVKTSLNARHPLGKGLCAAPGCLAARVVVVQDCQTIEIEALQGAILVTHHLEPLHLPWLKASVGVICEAGGITSHGAILARELGRPAIVGARNILKTLETGQWIFLDGNRGEVYAYEAKSPDSDFSHFTPSVFDPPLKEAPSTLTKVLVNLSQTSSLGIVSAMAADGVGVIRGEWLWMEQLLQLGGSLSLLQATKPEFKQNFRDALYEMIQAFDPRPVYYRSIDSQLVDRKRLRPDLEESVVGNSPVLGLRGSLYHSYDPEWLELELGILKDLLSLGATNLRLILPFVRSPQEVRFCLQKMADLSINSCHELPLWIMAEVPSILFALEEYVQLGIQGILIGMNDFTQLFLGIDRNHPAFEDILAQNQPAIMSAIAQLVQRATALKLPTILCGSITHYPAEWLDRLLKDGLSGISVEADGVVPTRMAIAQAEARLSKERSNARFNVN